MNNKFQIHNMTTNAMIRNTKLTINFNLDRFFCQGLIPNPSTVFFNLLQHLTFQSSIIFISNVYKKYTLLAMKIVIVEWSRNIHSTTRLKREFNTPTAHCHTPDILISKLMLLAWEARILQEYFLTSSGRSNSHELVSASPLCNHWTVRFWMMSRMLMSGMLQ